MRRPIARTLLVSLVLLVPGIASAGPPLLCFPMVTGGAPSLPWGTGGWNSPLASYDLKRLASDSMALLGPETTTLARMETLRRSVIYAASDAPAADQLFAALRARAAKADGTPGVALAQFDLGYAAEAFRQTRHAFSPSRPIDPSEDGYALIRQALAARSANPAMEYAAALVSMSQTSKGVSDQHLRRALAGASEGSTLARTIATHEPLWGARLASNSAASR